MMDTVIAVSKYVLKSSLSYMVMPDKNGSMIIVDGSYLDEELKKYTYKQERIDYIMKKVIVNDEIAMLILGLDKISYDAALEKGHRTSYMDAEFEDYDGRVDVLLCMVANSQLQSYGFAKLRLVVGNRMPYIKEGYFNSPSSTAMI